MVPRREMGKGTSSQEVLELILRFHRQLEAFYQGLHEKIVAPGQKELFASLATFKRNQADGIRKLTE